MTNIKICKIAAQWLISDYTCHTHTKKNQWCFSGQFSFCVITRWTIIKAYNKEIKSYKRSFFSPMTELLFIYLKTRTKWSPILFISCMSPNCRFFPSLWSRVWTLMALFQLNRHAKSNRHIRNVFEQRQAWPFYAAGPTWRDMITSCHLNCYHNVRTNVSGGGYFLWGNAHAHCLSEVFFFFCLFFPAYSHRTHHWDFSMRFWPS